MRFITVSACLVVLAAAACGNSEGEGSSTTQSTAADATAAAPDAAAAAPDVPRPIELPPTPATPTDPTAPGAAGAATPDGGAAAPATGGAVCAGGTSEDPIPPLLHPPRGLSLPAGQTELMRLKALMPQYPRSATLRVVAAGEALAPAPRGNPVEAQQLYQEALRMHDGGCRLTEGVEWQARQGLGNSFMMQENYAEALPVFQQIVGRWANITQSHYNLACAQCRSGNLEPCHAAFAQALQVAAAGQHPAFLRDRRSVGHYARLSRGDRDLVLLREDSRYQGLITPHITTE